MTRMIIAPPVVSTMIPKASIPLPQLQEHEPFYVVGSKETFNMKEGFSMKVRIDEFSYKGEDGQADEWISFIIADNQNVTPGDSTHGFGSGWVSLNRGTGDGNPTCENFWSHEKDAEGNGAAFAHQGQHQRRLRGGCAGS